MNKKEKEAVFVVLSELIHRLPKNKHEGFMPDDRVVNAIETLEESIKDIIKDKME